MNSAIAVVGMSGRFPGARDVDSFWKNLRQGIESIARFSAEELAASGIPRSVLGDPRFVNAAGALEEIEFFDAGLFGYNPREAETIDPQHRVFLECAWESLEHAGYNPFAYDGLIGVYAGTGTSTYSAMMEPILEPFAERLRAIQRLEPVVPWVSNLHGGWIEKAEATDPSYWTAHLRGAIRFSDGIGTLLEDPDRILLEVGPGQTLTRLARSHPSAKGRTVLASLPDSLNLVDDERHLLAALGQLFVAGVDIDWTGFQGRSRHRRVPLPTYPFERQRYWIEEKPCRAPVRIPASSPVSKANSPEDWVWVPTWRRTAPTTSRETPQGPWLVLDDGRLGTGLAGRLEKRHQQVIRVTPGAGFDRVSHRAFILDPEVRSCYRQLVGTLQAEGQMPARIVDLSSLRGEARRSFYSLLFLAQAFIDAGQTGPLEIAVVSRGLYDVTGNEPWTRTGRWFSVPARSFLKSVPTSGAGASILQSAMTKQPL
jgi:acyl transferase domain-containing protein